MFALIYFTRHPERSKAESNFFRLRSQTSLRSVCSSLRSEFDYAQDDVDEKSAEQSKAGSTKNQRTHIAHPKRSGALYISQRSIKKSFCGAFFKSRLSRHPISAQCSHKPRWKVFGQVFFKKLAGSRGAEPPKTALFFLRSFFFCASCVKRKSERMTGDVVRV